MHSVASVGITWESCPRCRRKAAVGWARVIEHAFTVRTYQEAIEFDCPGGCVLDGVHPSDHFPDTRPLPRLDAASARDREYA